MKQGVVVLLLALTTMAQSKAPDVLTQARQMYNDEKYDDAIRLAGEARTVASQASAASVVFARAHLERFRTSSLAGDLEAARSALRSVQAAELSPRDRVELLIALGVSLYLDDQYSLDDRYSAAAEQFEVALGYVDLLDARSRDLLFDWWAGSLDRQAQQGPETGRRALYSRIVARADAELARDNGAASATYWLPAAARGSDDLVRAVGAGVAGWVRAGGMGARGALLRADLDKLMRQVILPERARQLSSGADPRPTLALLERQWDDVTGKWVEGQ